MPTPESIFLLSPSVFTDQEKLVVQHGSLQAFAFRFSSGVCALRLVSDRINLVMLPFQGQQIWSAEVDGRNLTMKSMFTEPRSTQVFLHTYGGFFQHCGATAMGGPSEKDTHPLHGELPNAPYQSAFIFTGSDDSGDYIGLGGQYQYTVAFSFNYLAEPRLTLHADASTFQMQMVITNLKNSPMELMYLAHINFRPVDNGTLVYSAVQTPEHVRVRTSIPSHIKPGPGYVEFIDDLKVNPEKHHVLAPGLAFDPEIVFFIDYLADKLGWAHTLQLHPNGNADYVSHRPTQLDKGIRWLCRTPDQDALGMIEPATAEPEGYLAEKAKGNLKVLPAGGVFHADLVIGALSPSEAVKMAARIEGIIKGG